LESATLTDAALSAGEISLEQAEIVSRAVIGLPTGVSQADRAKVEARLISNAKLFSPPDLRRRVMRIADLYAGNGLVPFGGKVPEAQFDVLKASLDAVAAPRRRHLDEAPESRDDQLTHAQRMGRAFCTWIEHLPTDGFPTTGGTPAMVTVGTELSELEKRVEEAAPGTLSTGTRLSAGEVRRLACQMGVIPKVLGTQSVVLDQGRSQRLYTPAQRIALAERDHGCVYPGCDRPPGWCEAHHLDHWARDDGPTTLDNGALLCAFHHREVHARNLPMRLRANSARIQINGIWKINHRWRP
jgi:hypothetical protein